MRWLMVVLFAAVFLSCGEDRTNPVQGPSGKAGKVSGGGLFDLFKEGGSAIVGVDSTAAETETPADSTDAAVTDTTETVAVVTDTTEQVVSLTPEQARAELDRRGIFYRTWAFLDSAKAGNWEVVRLFVQAGMSVDTADRHGVTVLQAAASRGDLEVVKFLVGLGASIGATDEDDFYFTALHYAAEGGHLEVVQYLVGQGADVMAETDFGQTALHEAAYEGHLEVVEYLVERGADVEDTDEDGWTPSQWAAWAGHWDVVKYLESLVVEVSRTPDEARAELESRGIDYTAGSFNYAAFKGNLVVVKLFVQAGMSVETTTNTSGTVLQSAAAGGHWAVVKYLVGQGADVNAKDNVNGWPALHYAANNGHLAVVKYLVEQGADVNATSNSGRKARDLVVGGDHTDVADYLESVGG